MAEIIHRLNKEFFTLDSEELKLIIIEGLAEADLVSFLFSGFSKNFPRHRSYDHATNSIYAVTEEQWRHALEDGNDLDPIKYADRSSNKTGETPAIGSYQQSLLRQTDDPLQYRAIPNISIGDACVQVVVWDK